MKVLAAEEHWKAAVAQDGVYRMRPDIGAMTDRTILGPLGDHAVPPGVEFDALEARVRGTEAGFLICRPQ